jgi:prepilin-type processing-associated H-X9-DG protein
LFGQYSFVRFGEITDGTSNTLAMSEQVISQPGSNTIHGAYVATLAGDWDTKLETNPALNCYIYKGQGTTILPAAPSIQNLRGVAWAWGAMVNAGFTTILPPNSIGCTNNTSEWGRQHILPPDSNHPSGVNALRADGSVDFISSNIYAGNTALPATKSGPSPYGVWGALGSKAGGDQIAGQ